MKRPKLNRWWKHYRIVRDSYAGYEVQCWRIWFPLWNQCGFVNTHSTVAKAIAYAHRLDGAPVVTDL
jgi:hypothetical protein